MALIVTRFLNGTRKWSYPAAGIDQSSGCLGNAIQDARTFGMTPHEARILGGGLGSRLRPAVLDVPKPLAPITDRPSPRCLLEGLAREGLRCVVVPTGYVGDTVRAVTGPTFPGLAIAYVQEPRPLGTGGAAWTALAHCAGERVFVTNGDTWIGAPLAPFAEYAPGADLVLTVRRVADRGRYNSVEVGGDRGLGIEEKGPTGPCLVNAGLYVVWRDLPLRRSVLDAFSLEEEVLAEPRGLDIRAYRSGAAFIDIGTLEDYASAWALPPRSAAAASV